MSHTTNSLSDVVPLAVSRLRLIGRSDASVIGN